VLFACEMLLEWTAAIRSARWDVRLRSPRSRRAAGVGRASALREKQKR
jgi:hypothetical protein